MRARFPVDSDGRPPARGPGRMGDLLEEYDEAADEEYEEDWGGLLPVETAFDDWNVGAKEEEALSRGKKRGHDGEDIHEDDAHSAAIPQARELFAAAARDDVDTVTRLALSWHRRDEGVYTDTANLLLLSAHNEVGRPLLFRNARELAYRARDDPCSALTPRRSGVSARWNPQAGWHPLHIAAGNNSVESLRYLLSLQQSAGSDGTPAASGPLVNPRRRIMPGKERVRGLARLPLSRDTHRQLCPRSLKT